MASATAVATRADTPKRVAYRAEIFLVSFAGLLLEIAYTRVISFKLFYYYVYLIIGLALLGIGTGGVLVAIWGRLRRASTESILMWSCLLGALSVGLGYLLIARISIDTLRIWDYGTWSSFNNLARLVAICVTLFAAFISIGVVVATLFGRESEQIGRLYFADLIGAGLACAIVVALLGWIGPPATILLAALVLALTGLRLAFRSRARAVPWAAVLSVLLAVGVVAPSLLPEQRADGIKTDATDVDFEYTSWSPLFRVDVGQVPGDLWLLFHDGLPGSAMFRWDGKVSSLDRFEFDSDPRVLPFAVDDKPPRNVMIIGAAGGHEVLSSLYFDAGHIDAIELNPVTYDIVTDEFADENGHLAEQPKVNYVKGDGRTYLARSDDEYDLVWYPAPDSYSAANAATSGAFVLSESYLYTSDAVVDSLEHLHPNGVLATQFGEFNYADKPNRTSRYVSTVRKALGELGIDDPTRHILVSTSPAPGIGGGTLSTILVKKTPFTATEVDRYLTALEDVPGGELQYAPGRGGDDPVSQVVTLSDDELDAFYGDYPYDVRPITDDGPFFWNFVPFDDVVSRFADPIDEADLEDAIGERVLLLLLGVAILLAAVFLLLPFVAIRSIWTRLPRKPTSALYFACLGLGFLFFEITLIQKLVLFLGYPTYSLTVTLASILIFTGVGALLSGRQHLPPQRLALLLLGAITVLTLFYAFGLPELTDALLDQSLAVRVLVAFVVLAPLGLCLGMFMPLGLRAVAGLSEHEHEYVAWGWAVNGFASVIGAVLTTILAMTFGFQVVLFVALGVYVVALVALRSLMRASALPA
jgi:hypothetical protein